MKRYFLLVIFFNSAVFNYSQTDWNLVWSLDQKPFIDGKTDSELAIVKAGYDTDQDGWGEFLCAWTDKEVNYILMYEASGDNIYDLVWYWQYPVGTNTFAGIEVGDFDQNGKVEIITSLPTIVTGGSPERIWFFEWNGVEGENMYGTGELGSIQPTRGWNFNIENDTDVRPYGLTMEDIDNDGLNELIVGVRMGGRGREVLVCNITGGELFGFGAFGVEYNFRENFNGSLYNVTTGDLDGDGNREIYALVWADMTVRFFETTGHDQYELVTSLDSVTAGIDYGAVDGIRVADADKDGQNELYYAGTEESNTIFIISNISDISNITADDIVPFYSIPTQAEGRLRSMQITDHDKDGNINLMIAGERNGQIFDLEYSGSGDPADSSNWVLSTLFDIFEYSGYSPDSSITLSPRFFYGSPASDMDNDGKDEYVFVNYSTDFSLWPEDRYLWMIESDLVVGIEQPSDLLPNKINLSQNYPNPFNPETRIKFDIPDEGNVQLIVFDMLGNKIQEVINEQMGAGTYNIKFDGTELASGIYYYVLKANNTVVTNKMVLLK